MEIKYLIQDITRPLFWDNRCRMFKEYLYAINFNSEEEALNFAEKEVRGVFKITKIYIIK